MEIIFESLKKNKKFTIKDKDKALWKFMMLQEGECVIGVQEALKKYGYTEQRYYKLLKAYNEEGFNGLVNKKPGIKNNRLRTEEVLNQIIRMRFLDPFSSAEVISQKLNQIGYSVSTRSVERTITEYGLQKKRIFLTQRMKKGNKKLKFKHQEGKQKK